MNLLILPIMLQHFQWPASFCFTFIWDNIVRLCISAGEGVVVSPWAGTTIKGWCCPWATVLCLFWPIKYTSAPIHGGMSELPLLVGTCRPLLRGLYQQLTLMRCFLLQIKYVGACPCDPVIPKRVRRSPLPMVSMHPLPSAVGLMCLVSFISTNMLAYR